MQPAVTEEWAKRYTKFCRSFAAFHGNRTDAEDVAQDSVLVVLEAIRDDRIVNPEHQAFAYGVMRIKSLAHLRTRLRYQERHIDADAWNGPGTDPGTDTDLIQDERRSLLLRTLHTMRPLDEQILTRFYLDGQSHEDIETEMGITPKQFALRKSRAKAELTLRIRTIARRRGIPHPITAEVGQPCSTNSRN